MSRQKNLRTEKTICMKTTVDSMTTTKVNSSMSLRRTKRDSIRYFLLIFIDALTFKFIFSQRFILIPLFIFYQVNFYFIFTTPVISNETISGTSKYEFGEAYLKNDFLIILIVICYLTKDIKRNFDLLNYRIFETYQFLIFQQAPPLPIKKNSGEFNNSGSPLMTSFMASNSQTDNFASSLMQPSTSDRPIQGEANRRENHRHSSPQANAASRSLSFNNRPKHVPVPQVQPTTSGNGACFGSVPTPIYNHEYAVPPPCPNSDCKPIPTSMMHSYSHTLDRPPFHRGDQQRSVDSKSSIENERRCSSESREPVRTIRSGNMERCEWNETNKGRKREWVHGFVYLTSAHFILYKDERSAEKHGKHYDAPLCVWDLKGATISWNVEKDKKKRKVIQLELCNACRYLLRTSNDNETQEWFEALRDVIARLPPPTHQEIQSAILDSNSCSVMRNPSLVSHTPRPVSAASTVIVNKTRLRGRSDVMAQSAIETSTFEEGRPNRETILEKLRRFFRTRPSMETLKEKGIYKPEPVFGSTLSTICQHEKSLVPKFIRVVIEVIESKGLDTDGLYRVSGNLSAVQKIRCHVDQDNYKALVNEEDVHVLTGAFKLFFRELSEPLFPPSMHKDYISAMQNPIASSRFKKFDELLARLPSENKETLKSVLKHLTSVASHSQQNRMQLHNLSIMFGPTLFQSGERDEKKKGGKETNKKKKAPKEEKSAPVQSNSHLAFSMIMQSQIVQYLLETYQKFDALKGPIQYIP
ncbi:hypothetical protein WR25_04946 isoform C [Diploscapter pachys]|uniref:Rho-GAP domain-containing protein n=1 Tax=Diploscapter pachys TaxID=2018661 RepID=A0A2A2JR37_9BILA|nr:hypothetical protein WR25_04946 isoform C [Diploscapter pachys]